jgi:hypothetical protein
MWCELGRANTAAYYSRVLMLYSSSHSLLRDIEVGATRVPYITQRACVTDSDVLSDAPSQEAPWLFEFSISLVLCSSRHRSEVFH